jgi:hypothetical protein
MVVINLCHILAKTNKATLDGGYIVVIARKPAMVVRTMHTG